MRLALVLVCTAIVSAGAAAPARAEPPKEIACLADNPSGTIHGSLLSGDVFTALPDVPGAVRTEHIGLNNYGQIAGLYVDTDNLIHGYLRTGRALTVVDVPGASETAAVKVNDQGQVVGVYEVGDNTCHGFLWENGTVTRIDFPGAVATRAFGINDLGDVVGSYLDTNGTAHGFLLRGGV